MKATFPNLSAIIMAGGTGTRFWPLSTAELPKQFLRLLGERSLLQMTRDRLKGLVPAERILILTNEAFVGLVREQLPDLPYENTVGEPMRRDTAAAVCLGALLSRRRFGDGVTLVLPADHLIEPEAQFHKTVLSAARQAARSRALYTIGVRPTAPYTGYGYLEVGEKILEEDGLAHFRLAGFREKPERRAAEEYLASGGFFWNAGIFVWSTETILDRYESHLPGHLRALAEAVEREGTPEWGEALRAAFESLPTISVDYGIMEKAADVRCVEATFGWSDVGGWAALANHLPSDGTGNRVRGRLACLDAEDNLVFCEDREEKVMLIGVKGLVVVRSGGRTLIVPRERAEEIKKLAEKFQS